jgi:15-cis-phytoene synthase
MSMAVALPLESATPEEIAEAHRHCARIAKLAAGNFYYAFIVLPKSKRQGIQALYAFCRAGDDAADDEAIAAGERLRVIQRLRSRLDLCYKGLYCDPLTLALADAIRRFPFDRAYFDDLLLGVESDLTMQRIKTIDDLTLYCYRVASTVGLLCLKIFGAEGERAQTYAVELGIGMQLTNILRDLREDWRRGRVYLPEDELARFGLTTEDLFKPESRTALGGVILATVSRALEHFHAAETAFPKELQGRLLAARVMGTIYETILKRIKDNPLQEARIELTRREKLTIARKISTDELKNLQNFV